MSLHKHIQPKPINFYDVNRVYTIYEEEYEILSGNWPDSKYCLTLTMNFRLNLNMTIFYLKAFKKFSWLT